MIGSSSAWYAIKARLRSSRSSAARTSALEGAKEILRMPDERVRLLAPEQVLRVDAAPGDGHSVNAGGLRSADVERRVADVGRILGPRAESIERRQDRVGRGLVALGV